MTGQPRAYFASWDIKIRQLELLGREYVTPRMLRLTLGGPNTSGFESHLPDEHVKLVFPDPGTGITRYPTQDGDHLDWPDPFPPCREYTIRRYDRERSEVDIDVVMHDGGLAATWARSAALGSTIWVAGPRPSKVVPPEFTFLVLLGDETALPAIGRWIEELPAEAEGVAAIEIADAQEEQPLTVPDGFSLHWLHRNGAPAGTTSLLADFARGIQLPTDRHTYVFASAEAGCVKPIRSWARSHGIGRDQSDIGGYWRHSAAAGHSPSKLDKLRHGTRHLLRLEH